MTSLTIVGENDLRFTKFKRYIEKQWIRRTPANELSIFNAIQTTNNGAEIHHAKLKSEVVVKQPRIWHFVQVLNNIIADTDIDLDLERLRNGIEISRPTRKKSIQYAKLRRECKQKLEYGEYTPLQYLFALEDSNEPDINLPQQSEEILSETEESDDEETNQAVCCVCLQPRVSRILFYPCRHAKCCQCCSDQIGNSCPICLSIITDRIQIYT